MPVLRAACFNRRTCVRCPLDNRLGLVLLVLSAIGVNSLFGGRSCLTLYIPIAGRTWGCELHLQPPVCTRLPQAHVLALNHEYSDVESQQRHKERYGVKPHATIALIFTGAARSALGCKSADVSHA